MSQGLQILQAPFQSNEYRLALQVRRSVFVVEQGVPESIEIDEYEAISEHFVVLKNGQPVGAGRLRLKGSLGKFERIATLKEVRGTGVGRALMEYMQTYAARKYPTYQRVMHAQESAIPFYEKLGWRIEGERFFEAGIAHRLMIYR